ncbi:hypothetical protein ACTFIW_010884 [Dictyostelium discoideum]
MKLLIFYILLLVQIINAQNSLFDREYIKKGYTSPPTTIYSVSYNHIDRPLQEYDTWGGTVSRHDIINNSKSIKLFFEFRGYHLRQGDIMLIPNDETENNITLDNKFIQDPSYWRRGMSYREKPREINLNFGPKREPRRQCYSNDYFNITGHYFTSDNVGVSTYSSLNPDRKTLIHSLSLPGAYDTFHDQISHTFYMFTHSNLPDLYMVIVDLKNLSSNTFKISNFGTHAPYIIGAYKKSFYFGESSKTSKSYSIYKYDLTNIEPSLFSTFDSKNISYQLVTTIQHEISYPIPCHNLNYLIFYSKSSQILFMYNIDQSKMEEYYNFNMKEPTSRHEFFSFRATSGEPIEPEDLKKLNILIPILCSIIGFSLIVFVIILTVLIIKRRNYKKFNDSNNIEMEKDNESKQ